MNHIGTVRIETERLVLRPFREDDAQMMFDNWASDPEVNKYLTWPVHSSVEVTRQLTKAWACLAGESYNWCIELKQIGQPIGSLSVVSMDEEAQTMEIGYCIGRKFWGKGIVPEAARAVIDRLFKETGVKTITAKHDTENGKSGRVMQKAGMHLVEVRQKAAQNNLGLRDMAIYAIDNPYC